MKLWCLLANDKASVTVIMAPKGATISTVKGFKKCTNKTVKRFQMKSTGCRDVQHTGTKHTNKKEVMIAATTLVSKVHKQGASSNSQASLTSVAA